MDEVEVDFKWHAGMAPSQKKKNIMELHKAAVRFKLFNILEISSKSDIEVGRRLSAFNLYVEINGENRPLESVYQSAKVFRSSGPFPEVSFLSPREAKKFIKNLFNEDLIYFQLGEEKYSIHPKNAFYDWLYLRAIYPHRDWILKNVHYDGYTDIEFNPNRSLNCQARAFASFFALSQRSQLDDAVSNFDVFVSLLQLV